MKEDLFKLKSFINVWFDNLTENEMDNLKDGKPYHLMVEDSDMSHMMRAVIFIESYDSGDL